MYYRLLGFSQNGSIRQFSFERVGNGAAPVAFAVLADITLARTFKLSLQELPSLCAQLLQTGGDDQPGGTFLLTGAEMSIHAGENAAIAVEATAKRAARSRRAALAATARRESGVIA